MKDFPAINLYPNPVKDFLNIVLKNYPFNQYTIITSTGQTIKCELINRNEKRQINLSDLTTGTYMLVLKGKEQSKSLLFMKTDN